jgi:polyphenol oxidase
MTLASPLLSAVPGLRHAFFTREGGVSKGIYASLNAGIGSSDDPAAVTENRRRMADEIGVLPQHFLTLHQTHSPDVIIAANPSQEGWHNGARPKADAIVTRTAGLAIGASAADCGPILLVDASARVIGAAHAGWKGAVGGVLENTIAAMEKLGAERARLVVGIGPTISQANYEVGQDLRDRFSGDDARFFVAGERPGHYRFDLPGYVAHRLSSAGVPQVQDIGLCTYPPENGLFSYRRTTHRSEADYGRELSAILLKN